MSLSSSVIIIGGGPGGATAAWHVRQAGVPVTIIEKEVFPRYCVGESLLPLTMAIFREMGFDRVLEAEGFQRKYGACFGEKDAARLTRIRFADSHFPGFEHAYQVPRDRFDFLLLEHARQAGAEVVRGVVRDLLTEGDRVVGVVGEAPSGEPFERRAGFVIDASGRAAFIGRKRDLMVQDPRLDTTAIFGLHEWVEPPPEAEPGDIFFYALKDGWIWFIPFSDRRTSVGLVVDRKRRDTFGAQPLEAIFDALVAEAGGRVARHLAGIGRLGRLHTLNRFNLKAREFAGPGWALIGDAAMFIDPVFSAGVHVAVTEAREVARLITPPLLAGAPIEPALFDGYRAMVEAGYEIFSYYIHGWRDPVFRGVFCHPEESEVLVKTLTSILSGGVFDRGPIERGHRLFGKFIDLARARAAAAPVQP